MNTLDRKILFFMFSYVVFFHNFHTIFAYGLDGFVRPLGIGLNVIPMKSKIL